MIIPSGTSKVNIEKVIYEEELLVREGVRCLTISTSSLLFLGSTNKISVYRLPEWKLVAVYEWTTPTDDTDMCEPTIGEGTLITETVDLSENV